MSGYTARWVRIVTLGGVVCVLGLAQVWAGQDPTQTKTSMDAKSSLLSGIRVLHQSGARPRFSPDRNLIIFDRQEESFYHVYVSDLRGEAVRSITKGRPGVPQRNNGNARFHPSGRYLVFVSEEEKHFGTTLKTLGDSGIGLFSNFRATTPDPATFWTLTDTPIKRTLLDRTEARAVVNPVFSPDGGTFVWTERYAAGGNHNWGRWRIKAADFVVINDRPELQRERVLYTPKGGNYATAMGYLDGRRLLFAGNPEGQHEFGMDLYLLDLSSGRIQNLTQTPKGWEEGSCIAPNGRIVYISNAASRYELNYKDPNWAAQPLERDYFIMNSDGSNKERLTFFNDPSAPQYLGGRSMVAACDVSRDGRYLAGTLGVDLGKGDRASLALKPILLEFRNPQK